MFMLIEEEDFILNLSLSHIKVVIFLQLYLIFGKVTALQNQVNIIYIFMEQIITMKIIFLKILSIIEWNELKEL
jgi:hypothetical protein